MKVGAQVKTFLQGMMARRASQHLKPKGLHAASVKIVPIGGSLGQERCDRVHNLTPLFHYMLLAAQKTKIAWFFLGVSP